jgi:hypothetical protein
MDASVQQTLTPFGDYFPGFTPNSPEEKWLEETLKASKSSRQGGLSGALTPASAGPRQLFGSSPLPPRVEEPITKNSPAAAAADATLHDWLEQIEGKKALISPATAAVAAASNALETAAGTFQTITTTLNPLTSEIPAEHKQATPEQAAARPPAATADFRFARFERVERFGQCELTSAAARVANVK